MEILFIIGIAIAILISVVYRLNAPKRKGAKGEYRVARKLRRLQNEEFKVFNDVIISTRYGSSQIDHIVISIYGIFVIETKNYTGWIHGNENSEYWSQTLYKKKRKFRNPIRQNWSHIYALKKVLSDFKQVSYHPIIVFTGDAKLKNINSEIPVIYRHELIRTIKDKNGIPNLSIEQVDIITERIHRISKQKGVTKKEHIRQVKKHALEKKRREKAFVCPWCGGELVARKGEYGKFYGCSNYPRCKYTRK